MVVFLLRSRLSPRFTLELAQIAFGANGCGAEKICFNVQGSELELRILNAMGRDATLPSRPHRDVTAVHEQRRRIIANAPERAIAPASFEALQ
jgi:hypothetical protein